MVVCYKFCRCGFDCKIEVVSFVRAPDGVRLSLSSLDPEESTFFGFLIMISL